MLLYDSRLSLFLLFFFYFHNLFVPLPPKINPFLGTEVDKFQVLCVISTIF